MASEIDKSYSTHATLIVKLPIEEKGSPSSFGMSEEEETSSFTKTDWNWLLSSSALAEGSVCRTPPTLSLRVDITPKWFSIIILKCTSNPIIDVVWLLFFSGAD